MIILFVKNDGFFFLACREKKYNLQNIILTYKEAQWVQNQLARSHNRNGLQNHNNKWSRFQLHFQQFREKGKKKKGNGELRGGWSRQRRLS